MRVKVLILILLAASLSTASAATFHGDVQRTGYFDCVGVKTKGILWKTSISGLVDSSPVYWKNKVFVSNWYGWGDWKPGLYCISADTGEVIWRNEKITGASTASVSNGLLFVGSLSGNLYCVNATTGEILWNETLEKNPSWYGIASSPLVYNGKIYVTTFSDGSLHCLDFDGNELWAISTGNEISHYTSPSAYNGRILFAGNDSINKLYCVDEFGKLLWSFNVKEKIKNTPAIGYGNAYFATLDKFYCINISNGLEVWNVSLNGTISTAAIAYGNVYIGSKNGEMYCFNSVNGSGVWKFKAVGKIDSSPAIADGVVYFATNTPNGTIYALNASNGKLIWSYSLNPPKGYYYNIMSSPFVAGNKLFIGADDGNVYCFSPIIWSGEVKLNPSKIKIKLKDGNVRQIKGNTALAALIKASKLGKFNVTVVNSTWGLYVESIANVKPKGLKGWMYAVNGNMPSVGAADYTLNDGDVIEFFYGSWGETVKNAEYEIVIHANITNVLWNGSIELKQGNFTIFTNNTKYKVSNLTALGALNYASIAGGFNYTVNDRLYKSWDLLLVNSIFGIENNGTSGWTYWVNYPYEPMPMTGANKYKVKDGDIVYWYYSKSMNDTPSTSPYVIKIKVKAENVKINSFEVSNAKRGGYATAWVNLSVANNGWYVVVVSGINNGEAIAGVSTAYFNAGNPINVPVIIPIPQQVPTGNYKLYVGVYDLKTFPSEITKWYGYRLCEVS